MAELMPNNVVSKATDVRPFYTSYGFNPQFNVELPSTPTESENLSV